MTLSYGQASVKHKFIANETLLVDDLSVISLVLQWVMYDHMNANNLHPHTLEIAAPLLFHLWSSCQRYQQQLDDQTKKNVTNGKQLKWKALDEQMDTGK